MKKMRLLTILTLLVLLFPSQGVLAGTRRPLGPTISVAPYTVTTPRNSTVLYKVTIDNIPPGGMHCLKVDLRVPGGYKLYPGNGVSYYHFYAPATLDFKVKVPNTTQRRFFSARMNYSRDYACRSIRTSIMSTQVEIIVSK